MAQDYNFKPSLDVAGIAQLMQRKAIAEEELKLQKRAQRMKEIEQIIGIGGSIASGAVQASKLRQQKEFAEALAKTKMTPGETTQVPDQYAQAPEEQAVRTPTHAFGNGVGPTTNVVEGVPQEDGTVAPQAPVAIPAHEVTGPPTDNPISNAVRAAARVNPEEASKQFMEQQFPGPQGAFGMYGSGVPVRNKGTGERAFAQFGKDGSVFVNGQKLAPEDIGQWDREYAPAAIETTGGVLMAPKVPGASYDTAGAAADKKEGKITRDSYTVPELAHLNKVKASLEGDGVYQKTSERDAELQQAMAAVDTENWVGDASILSVMAKGLGKDVGNLAQQEQARYQASPELIRRIQTKASRWARGVITPEDREDIREAIRIAGERNQDIMNRRTDLYERKAMSGVRNGNKEYIRTYLSGTEDKPAGGGLQIDQSALDAELKKRGLQ